MERRHNCLTYAAFKLGWSSTELHRIGIEGKLPGLNNMTVERFLLFYALHLGSSEGMYNRNLAKKANVLTFYFDSSQLSHIAVIDETDPTYFFQRQGWDTEIERVTFKESSYHYLAMAVHYWKVPKTAYFQSFLGN